jgi:energy-coupling factor transporter ATP-binding protein EcfA2
MITNISISNFRCFQHVVIDQCKRINIIVGDNGVGKTALLEAIFLTLSSSIEVSARLKAHRGITGTLSGSMRTIEESIWRDYFYNLDWLKPIFVRLSGHGPAARSLTISRNHGGLLLPISPNAADQVGRVPLNFQWIDQHGKPHDAQPLLTKDGLQVPTTTEDIPDSFLFSANQTASSTEVATRFSELSRAGTHKEFIDIFKSEFPWLTDMSIEVSGGAPVLHASIDGMSHKIPINLVSGGVNRITSILLTIAAQKNGVVLVDEMENGIYYKHKANLWSAILRLARRNDVQLFLTTHDEEWLRSLLEATRDYDDIALWRVERHAETKRTVRVFDGHSLVKAVAVGEVR